MNLAQKRLMTERRHWRQDHPYGFYAKPTKNRNGTANMMLWECGIPGKAGTPWEGGLYKLTLRFTTRYPTIAPICHFEAGFPHVNVYPNGKICLSIINPPSDGGKWKPSVTIKQIVIGVQELLNQPNIRSAAQQTAANMFQRNYAKYIATAKKYARAHRR